METKENKKIDERKDIFLFIFDLYSNLNKKVLEQKVPDDINEDGKVTEELFSVMKDEFKMLIQCIEELFLDDNPYGSLSKKLIDFTTYLGKRQIDIILFISEELSADEKDRVLVEMAHVQLAVNSAILDIVQDFVFQD